MKISNYVKSKAIPYTLALGLSSGLLTGCKETKIELSDILHEDAIVSDVVYTPSRHGSGGGMGPTIDITGDGGIGVAMTSVSVHIPEKYAVVFKCQHGKFIVGGTDKQHRDIWERFSEGQNVDISYREVFKSVYDDIDGDGKDDLLERKLIDYDFLDAQPKN